VRTAALLPTPGDPLLARYWVRNYEQTWKGEVDTLCVLVNGQLTEDIVRIWGDVAEHRMFVDRQLGHGQAMRKLLDGVLGEPDVVVFMEDDAFVREPGAIRSRLERAYQGEVIGCPRGGMDPAIAEAATEKWGPIVGPDGSSGHGLWPAFLFARRDAFLATDRRFESTTWQTGERVPGLGYRVPRPMTTDTMTAVAFQLRDQFPITLDVNYKEMDQKVFPGAAPYFHAGGLSNDPHAIREGIPPESNEGRDWAHRFWWWRRIGHDYDPKGQDVDYWTPIIEPWINWDE
jgi:hypothetical protein